MSTTILYPAAIAYCCNHGKRLVDDCRECEPVPEDGHDLWLTHSSEGFYVQG